MDKNTPPPISLPYFSQFGSELGTTVTQPNVNLVTVPKQIVKVPTVRIPRVMVTPSVPFVQNVQVQNVPRIPTTITVAVPKVHALHIPRVIVPGSSIVPVTPNVPRIPTTPTVAIPKVPTTPNVPLPGVLTTQTAAAPKIPTNPHVVSQAPITTTLASRIVPTTPTVPLPKVPTTQTAHKILTNPNVVGQGPITTTLAVPRVPTTPTVPLHKVPTTPTVPLHKVPTSPTVPKVPTNQTVALPKVTTNQNVAVPKVPTNQTVALQKVPTNQTVAVPKVPTNQTVSVLKVPTNPTIVVSRVTTTETSAVPKVTTTPRLPKQQTTQKVPPVTETKMVKVPKVQTVTGIIPLNIEPVMHIIGIPRKVTQIPNVIGFTPEVIDEDTIIEYSNKLDKVNFEELLKFLGDQYHNDESLVSDETYDELVDIYEAKYEPYHVVGAEPTGEKVKLPYYLGSLRKIKKENELTKWLENYPGPYIVEDKIDGLTLLLVSVTIMGRRATFLYTRGGGYRGLNVSHLLNYMKLPVLNEDIAIRGEIVITKEAFSRIGTGFKNARNLVSGVVNSKKQFNPATARELSFYAYRIMNKVMTPEEDINELRARGFMVPNPVAALTLTGEILENYFNQRKKDAPYEMDGLVIYQNRVGEYPEGEAPRHLVAFKTGTESGVTTVTRVVWRASKGKLLKPVVHYETVNLSGADLTKASGYNARFIVNNNIGPGAKILLTRSGDVIPKILSVIAPAPGGPDYPDSTVHGKYEWNENGVELVVTDDNQEVITGKLKHLLDTLGVKNAGKKRVQAMVAAGITSITALLNVSPLQLASIPGIGPTLSNQLYQDIHDRITNVPLARIMDASGIFDKIGERRFEMILSVYPNLLDWAYLDPKDIATYLRGIKGFNILADQIAIKLADFTNWLKEHPQITTENPITSITQPVKSTSLQVTARPTLIPVTTVLPTQQTQGRNLTGMTFVFSGFRDRDLEDSIRVQGGRVTSTVSKNTTLLIMKDVQDLKGKGKKAMELGISITSKEEFQRTYL